MSNLTEWHVRRTCARSLFGVLLRGTLVLAQALVGSALLAQAPDDLLQRGLTRGCLFAYYPSKGEVWAQCDFSRKNVRNPEVVTLGKSFTQATVSIVKAGTTKTLADTTQSLQDGMSQEFCLKVPPLEGKYEIRFSFPKASAPVVVTRTFERQKFAWEGNTLGITDEVYPPFEAIQVKGDDVRIVQRRYRMNGMGLWDSVVSKDREILAGPMTVRYELADGQPGQWKVAKGRFTVQKPTLAVFQGGASSDAVNFQIVSSIEFDGCMKVEMDLLPGSAPKEIRKLWLEIPLKNAEVPLFHEYVDCSGNYAGSAPAGEGVVWTGKEAKRMAKWQNTFCPYMWLGAEERGLAWFAENDKGWITEKDGSDTPLQDLYRDQDRLLLRVYLINTPATITAAHHLIFGLQASPTKPMTEGWRKKARVMPPTVGCVIPWGGLDCGYKGPWHDDWQIVDKILEARATGTVDHTWFTDYARKNNLPPVVGLSDWVKYNTQFSTRCRGTKNLPVTTYHEGGVISQVLPDFLTFQDEWGLNAFTQRDWPDESIFRRGYSVSPDVNNNYPPSYQAYGVYYANEWAKRGVGLYWDNTYPKVSTNLLTTAAYVTEHGAIQPSMTIWGLRDYSKRVWNVLQYWRAHQPYPLVWMKHMTNCAFLPIQTWGTSQLDIELGGMEPFSPEFLRTESTGRQLGNEGWTLYPLYGRDNNRLKDLNAAERSRVDWGMSMVHEAKAWGMGGSSATYASLEKIIVNSGYGLEGIQIGNYWDEQSLAAVNNDQVKWLVLADPRTKDVLLVLASWLTDAVTVEVTLDAKALGFTPGRTVVDAETHQALGELQDGRIQVNLSAPYGARLLRFTAGGPAK